MKKIFFVVFVEVVAIVVVVLEVVVVVVLVAVVVVFFLYVARDLLLIFPHTILTHYLLLYIYIHFIGLWISFRTSTAPVEPLSVCFLFVCEIEGMRCW